MEILESKERNRSKEETNRRWIHVSVRRIKDISYLYLYEVQVKDVEYRCPAFKFRGSVSFRKRGWTKKVFGCSWGYQGYDEFFYITPEELRIISEGTNFEWVNDSISRKT